MWIKYKSRILKKYSERLLIETDPMRYLVKAQAIDFYLSHYFNFIGYQKYSYFHYIIYTRNKFLVLNIYVKKVN